MNATAGTYHDRIVKSTPVPFDSVPFDSSRLISRNAEGTLSAEELGELDAIIGQIDELNLLKARAEYTLRQQDQTNDQ